jgi:glycosyltransferase involved in cell wall biosynthesis
MTSSPRVSIVTPFLDAGAFLEPAIESVLAQTFDRWELLLVDDGSTDGSSEVARRFAGTLPDKVKYLTHPHGENRGASASRNLGTEHAAGEYLAFLDADDVYLPHKLAEQVRILDQASEAQVLYGATEYWHSWNGVVAGREDWIWHPRGVQIGNVIQPPHALETFLNDGGTVPCMGSVLARRAAVLAVGGWEDSFRTICTDQAFHAKLTLRFPVLFHDVCWDRYRQHANSSCHRVAVAGQTQATFEIYLRWLERYLDEQGADDATLRAALRKALRPYDHPLLMSLTRQATRQGRRVAAALARARGFQR